MARRADAVRLKGESTDSDGAGAAAAAAGGSNARVDVAGGGNAAGRSSGARVGGVDRSPSLSLELFGRLNSHRTTADTNDLLRRLSASAADRHAVAAKNDGGLPAATPSKRTTPTRRWSLASAFGSFRSRRRAQAIAAGITNDGGKSGGDSDGVNVNPTAASIARRPSQREREASIEACVDIPLWVRSTNGDVTRAAPPLVPGAAASSSSRASSGITRSASARAAPRSPARTTADSGPIATSSAERPRAKRHRAPPRRAESALVSHQRRGDMSVATVKYTTSTEREVSKYSVEYALSRAPTADAWSAARQPAPAVPLPASILKSKLFEPEKVKLFDSLN